MDSSTRGRHVVTKLKSDLSDGAVGAVATLILLLSFPIPTSDAAALALVVWAVSCVGVSLLWLTVPRAAHDPLVRTAAGSLLGFLVVTWASVLLAPVSAIPWILKPLIPVVVILICRLREGDHAQSVETGIGALPAIVVGSGLILASGFTSFLPVCLAALVVGAIRAMSRQSFKVSVRAALNLLAAVLFVVSCRLLMSQWQDVRRVFDLVNTSADGLQFEAWGRSVIEFGPLDDSMKVGSKLSYHWLSYALGETWARLAGADRWVVSAVGLNVIAAVSSVTAAAGFVRRGRHGVRARSAIGLGAVAFLAASLVQPSFPIPMDSPSQAVSVSSLLVAWLVLFEAVPRASWRHAVLAFFLCASTFMLKTLTGALLVASLAAVWGQPRLVGRARRGAHASASTIPLSTLVAGGVGVIVAYVVLLRDPSGFSYASLTVVTDYRAWLGGLSYPFARVEVLVAAAIAAMLWRFGAGIIVAAHEPDDGWVLAVVVLTFALAGLGVIGNSVQIGSYTVGLGAAFLALLAIRSRLMELEHIGRNPWSLALVLTVGAIGAVVTAFLLMRLYAHELGPRTVGVALGLGVVTLAVVSLIVRSLSVGVSRHVMIAAACLALSSGSFVAHCLRGEIRSVVDRQHGWTHAQDERREFANAVDEAQRVAAELLALSAKTDIVGTSRPTMDLPLVSSLTGRRTVAERHISAYYPASSAYQQRLRALDHYAVSGNRDRMDHLRSDYCVKWFVAFEPSVLSAYEVPARVVYRDDVATLIEFPDPPGGSRCVPSDVRARD
jgi:hypothetical protein